VKRWKTVLGRGGTTLIAISLALLLVSLIPPIRTRGLDAAASLTSDTFTPLRLIPEPIESFFDAQLNPQQGLEMEFSVTGNVTVYVLQVTAQTVVNWTSSQQGTKGRDFNLTSLEEFLEMHPDSVAWSAELYREEIGYTYVPEKVTNATIILANPSSGNVLVMYQVRTVSMLAPGDKVRTIAYFAAPIGVIMAVPWLLSGWKQRKQK